MPPVNRNIGAKEKPANLQRPDPAYKNSAPIHDPEVATKVYHRYLESPITLTNRELLSLSPEIRSQVRESTTTRRAPQKDTNTQQSYLDQEEGDYDLLNLLTPSPSKPRASLSLRLSRLSQSNPHIIEYHLKGLPS